MVWRCHRELYRQSHVLLIDAGPSYYMCSAAVDRNPDPTSVYKMIFDAGSQGHVASTSFIYSADTGYWTAANNQTLAQIMTDYFLSFAITLNPNTLKKRHRLTMADGQVSDT
jgi:hypothetical protein